MLPQGQLLLGGGGGHERRRRRQRDPHAARCARVQVGRAGPPCASCARGAACCVALHLLVCSSKARSLPIASHAPIPLQHTRRILWILKHFKFMRFSTLLGGLAVSHLPC